MPNVKTYQELNEYLEGLERRIETLEKQKPGYNYDQAAKTTAKEIVKEQKNDRLNRWITRMAITLIVAGVSVCLFLVLVWQIIPKR